MKMLIWSCLLCLACNNVCGMFFELPDKAAASTDDNIGDDFISKAVSGINEHFSIQEAATIPEPPRQHKDNNIAGATTATTTGFLDEIESSLDEFWQQFRKGVLSLVGDSDNDDSEDTDRRTESSLQQLHITTNSVLAKVASTATTTVSTTTRLTATTTIEPPQL